jgi:hypothetical protein
MLTPSQPCSGWISRLALGLSRRWRQVSTASVQDDAGIHPDADMASGKLRRSSPRAASRPRTSVRPTGWPGVGADAFAALLRAAERLPAACLAAAQLVIAAQLAIAAPAAAQSGAGRVDPPASSASAAPPAPRSCSREAGSLKGDKRRAFMSRCLSERNAPGVDRTRACQAKAGSRKGSERASFVRRCASSPAAA